MASLRELSQELQELYALAEELPSDEKDVFKDTLEALQGDMENKLDGMMAICAQIDADKEMLKKEEDRLSARRTVLENNENRIKERIKYFIEQQPERSFNSQYYKFSIRKNAPALKYDELTADIPIKFLIPQPPKFDKEAMKKELKAGVEYEGFKLVQSESLIIK